MEDRIIEFLINNILLRGKFFIHEATFLRTYLNFSIFHKELSTFSLPWNTWGIIHAKILLQLTMTLLKTISSDPLYFLSFTFSLKSVLDFVYEIVKLIKICKYICTIPNRKKYKLCKQGLAYCRRRIKCGSLSQYHIIYYTEI